VKSLEAIEVLADVDEVHDSQEALHLKAMIAEGRAVQTHVGLARFDVMGQTIRVKLSDNERVVVSAIDALDWTPDQIRRVGFALLALSEKR
jgi:hypothetical protein